MEGDGSQVQVIEGVAVRAQYVGAMGRSKSRADTVSRSPKPHQCREQSCTERDECSTSGGLVVHSGCIDGPHRGGTA